MIMFDGAVSPMLKVTQYCTRSNSARSASTGLSMRNTIHWLNSRPGMLRSALVCACSLPLVCAAAAVGEDSAASQRTFKLQATVIEKDAGWAGARDSSGDPFWSHDGIGDGESIAISEDKKAQAHDPAAAADSPAKSAGGGAGADKEKTEPAAAPKNSDAPGAPTEPATKTEAPTTPGAEKGSTSTAAPQSGAADRSAGKGLDGSAVDWSQWGNELADRWYKNLIELERKSGKGFNTLRPAKIRFTCYPDGSIKNITVYRSCGIPEYDRMQIEALKKTQPLLGFPGGTKRKKITMLQGWESRKKKAGEKDFELGSYGKKMPVERVRSRKRPTAKPAPEPTAKAGAPKPTAKPGAPKPTPKPGAPKPTPKPDS